MNYVNMNSMQTCNSVTIYIMKKKTDFLIFNSKKCILPNMIGVVIAPIIFGKMHFLLISENLFFGFCFMT